MTYYGQEPNSKPKKQLNKSKILKIIIFLLLIISIIILIILYKKNNNVRNFLDLYIFRKMINEDNVSYVEIDNSKDLNIYAFDKYVVVLNQNTLKFYNKSGIQEHALEIEISNPIFETNGNYLCIAEKDGQKLYLISGKSLIWQKDIEGKISNINVNKNGYVSVTITGTSYKTVIQTFNSTGNDLFKFYLGTTNVIDTDISNDNKYLAIAEANFSGVIVESNIKIISIEDAKNGSSESIKYTHIAKPNDLVINIKYNNKNNLICMYDEHIDVLRDGENAELFNLTNEDIIFADINLSSKITKINKIMDGPFNSRTEMQIVSSSNTNDIIRYEIDNIPKNLYVQGNMIALNFGTNVMFVNQNGWLVKKYESKQREIQNIVIGTRNSWNHI